MKEIDAIKGLLKRIYGKEHENIAFEKILKLIERFPFKQKTKGTHYFSQKDVVLITYGDSLNKEGEVPLSTLCNFADKYFKGIFSTIHILPFSPFSSDDGFSIIDFYSVNPELGSWKDIKKLSTGFKLMFDLVLNHISSKSSWFNKYLEDEKGYEGLCIEVDPSTDLSDVVRPRSLPLLTEFKKSSGKTVHVWTTFSSDQIDFNYKSPDVLEKMIEILLFYVKNGAQVIRLDAIAYLWKETGTNCIHLSQTHDVVKLFRIVLDLIAPEVIIITETNVPHEENISYFGDGKDEAQMVYNFTLPPLLFYSFAIGDSKILSDWAKGLNLESSNNTFFNFTASHDGIGVRPLEGILPNKEIDRLVEIVRKNGGYVSFKKNSDGTESPYEMNITYVDALIGNEKKLGVNRFLASQAIQLALPGVPAVYIHSILGSRNWREGVRHTNRNRTINREKLQIEEVLSQLKNPESFRFKIFSSYINLIKVRKRQRAFHPNASFEVLDIKPEIFAIVRCCDDQTIYSFTNISSKHVCLSLSGKGMPSEMKDILTGKMFNTDSFLLTPYQYVWLRNDTKKYEARL
ncbi:MAG: sugar phosphorylase [Desulfobacterales bacterium]|nr:sugar phosphorylase [Desulfobacterales bacterium]